MVKVTTLLNSHSIAYVRIVTRTNWDHQCSEVSQWLLYGKTQYKGQYFRVNNFKLLLDLYKVHIESHLTTKYDT
jgi:hypothetical protein